MIAFWSRLSAKTKERIIRTALYIVFIVVFWLFGPSEKISKATAFFGLAALTGIYNVGFTWAKKILKG
ncbi:MAG TPA: hypothetical protein ENO03_06025 [Candidatus Aminicenantes bacterium]|nr:hypothetical protein [Candidatus Aminicenantes bacterium]